MSVVDIMHKVPSGVILQYGGHFASGGFSIADEAIHHLEEHLNSAYDLLVKDNEKDGVEIEPEYIDIELTLDDINWNFYEKIEKLAPFGIGNKKPVFIFNNIKIIGVKEFGKNGNKHLELSFKKVDGQIVKAIGFFMSNEQFKTKEKENIKVNDSINLIATMEKSMFGGRIELRLRIVDII